MDAFSLPGVALVGVCAGLLAGLLGVGGGLVIVPALVWLFSANGVAPALVMQLAIGTSLASILFTGLSSVRAHQALGAVRWDLVRLMAPALALGAFAGGFVAELLGGAWLMRLFGLFAAAIGVQMWLGAGRAARGEDTQEQSRPGALHQLASVVIGVASALFGIGGGSLSVPWLSSAGVRMQQAVATSAACGVPIALAGAAGFIVSGWARSDLPAGTVGFVHLPTLLALVLASVPMAVVGARLAHRLPAAALKRCFAAILLLVSADFLLR